MDIALIQAAADLDPERNRARLAELWPTDEGESADLVVFPEAFARDFGSPHESLASYAEGTDGPFAGELTRLAEEHRTTVVAGMFETAPDSGRPFNTLVMRGRASAEYRKIHLYDSFGYRESDRLTAGEIKPVTVRVGDLTVGLMTCYDLRFPELARALVDQGADLLVIPAAWVAGGGKVDHWRTLVRARAIENTVFVAACGQPVPRYSGHSLVVDPLGVTLVEAGEEDETVVRARIDPARIGEARETNPSLENRRL